MQQNCIEVFIPRIRVKGCIWIVVELNVEHTFTTRYVKGRVCSQATLLPHVGGGVSHLSDLMILTLGLVFEFDIAWRIVRLVFIHSVAFLLDVSVVFFFAFAQQYRRRPRFMCTHVKRATSHLIKIIVQIEHGPNGVDDHVNIIENHFQGVRAHNIRRLCYIS